MGTQKLPPAPQKEPGRHDPSAAPAPFVGTLIAWFDEVAEDYPWRQTRDPYAVLVSEIMLQQTQVATVLGKGYFERWMRLFPDVQSLADAPEDEVLKAWEGLGYYRRARNLQAAAKAIVSEHGGDFPTEPEQIHDLPGVGRYTAGAVSTFAFGLPEPIVDANIARVLSRLFDFGSRIDTTAGTRQIWEWAEKLVPARSPRIYNSAIMELGQKICRPKNPNCHQCPVQDFCRCIDPAALPLKKKPRETVLIDEHVVFARREEDGAVLLEQESGTRRHGMWKLPEVAATDQGTVLHTSTYGITHHRVTLITHAPTGHCSPSESSARWATADDLGTLTIAPAYRRVIETLLDELPLS